MSRGGGGGSVWTARALVLLRVAIGLFLIAKSVSKWGWLLDASPLTAKLVAWSAREDLAAASRAYAQMLVPGAPVFGRLVLLGELGGGLALIAGFWTRPVAALSALMVLNFHLASGGLFTPDFLNDASGLVVVAVLVALGLGARNLPLSVAG